MNPKNEKEKKPLTEKEQYELQYPVSETINWKVWTEKYNEKIKAEGWSDEVISQQSGVPWGIVKAMRVGVIPDRKTLHELSALAKIDLKQCETAKESDLHEEEQNKESNKKAKLPKPKRASK